MFARARRPHRRRHHRGRARQHGRRPAAARLQRRAAPPDRSTHGALLIQDEVLTGFRVGLLRLVGARGPARGLGGRPATRSARSSAAACPSPRSVGAATSWPSWPPSAPSTRRARCPGTRWRRRPAWPRCGSPTQSVYARVDAVSAQLRAELSAALSAEGLPHADPVGRQPVQHVLRRRRRRARRPRLRGRAGHRVVAVRAVLPLAARLRRVRAAVAVRGVVRLGRARRRRGRPDRQRPPGRRPPPRAPPSRDPGRPGDRAARASTCSGRPSP